MDISRKTEPNAILLKDGKTIIERINESFFGVEEKINESHNTSEKINNPNYNSKIGYRENIVYL